MPRKAKNLLRRAGYRFFPRLLKAILRYRVLRKPLGLTYPFEAELKIVRQLVEPGKAFIDVGAHVGTYGYMVEDIIGADSLYMFEPLPWLYKSLHYGFGKAHVSACALSDKSGKSVIHIPHINDVEVLARSSLCDDIQEHGQTSSDTLEVETITLDKFVAMKRIPAVGFIKIDVEGHEMNVLQGAQSVIARMHPVLQVEIEQRHHDKSVKAIFDEIESWGYKGYYLDRHSLKLQPVAMFDAETMQDIAIHLKCEFFYYINNFLFFPVAETETLRNRVDTSLAIDNVHPVTG
jgi:FkbM family methyltransferase